jgi:hypothetical protein
MSNCVPEGYYNDRENDKLIECKSTEYKYYYNKTDNNKKICFKYDYECPTSYSYFDLISNECSNYIYDLYEDLPESYTTNILSNLISIINAYVFLDIAKNPQTFKQNHTTHTPIDLIETLKTNPGNRRMVLSLWQNEWLETAALPSCVWNSQWNLIDGHLNLLVTSRSSDVPLGLPFNIVQYAVLCHLIAHCIGAKPGQFTFITNDAHIYENQIEGIKEQINRYDKAVKDGTLPKTPKLWINPKIKDFHAFDNSRELKDIRLDNYENLGRIVMPVTE